MFVRLTIAGLLVGAAALAAPASATEVCRSVHLGAKFNGLWVGGCVGDERDTPVYLTCGSYNMTCAR